MQINVIRPNVFLISMKLLTYKHGGELRLGALTGDRVLDLNAAFNHHLGGTYASSIENFRLDMLSFLDLGPDGLAEARKAIEAADSILEDRYMDKRLFYGIDEVIVMAPIQYPRKNIVCLGLNYADHVREGRQTLQQERSLPKHPIYFSKPPTTVTGPYSDIVYPKATERLDYEVELALIIGKKGKNIPESNVYEHIACYTVFNDISARDLQTRHGQWYKGKSCDTFSPIGPYLVTVDEVGDPMDLGIWLKVNGVTRQESNTCNMIFQIPKLVSDLSQGTTLEVGDIIATGTPSGVGSAHELGLLKIGDVIETGIEKIGVIRNKVVAET
jgi:2-keto-4-pentenoate hydratase/2-oxohepta-3-ene-1,7-dioic acid hydratase in catechol pathway